MAKTYNLLEISLKTEDKVQSPYLFNFEEQTGKALVTSQNGKGCASCRHVSALEALTSDRPPQTKEGLVRLTIGGDIRCVLKDKRT